MYAKVFMILTPTVTGESNPMVSVIVAFGVTVVTTKYSEKLITDVSVDESNLGSGTVIEGVTACPPLILLVMIKLLPTVRDELIMPVTNTI